MKTSNLAFTCLSVAMLAMPAYANTSDNTGPDGSKGLANITKADCSRLPTEKNQVSAVEYKRRTEWCNKMASSAGTKGNAGAGKDSSAIAGRGTANTNGVSPEGSENNANSYNN